MSDTDFFRHLVADRAQMAPVPSLAHVIDNIADASLMAATALRPADVLDALIHIAALCERAAVDLTLPASRAAKKKGSRKC